MRRRTSTWLAALSVGLAALFAAPPAHAAESTDRGPSLYVPEPNPAAYRQAVDLARAGRYRDAAGLLTMVNTPQAVWFGDQTPAQVERLVRGVVRDAGHDDASAVLALYNIPGRDCSNYSAGGAADTAEYKAWIDAVARGIGHGNTIVTLEPDALALLPSDCGQDDAQGTKTAARYAEVNYAVDKLEPLSGTRVYLDTGHPGWHTVSSIVPRLIRGGVARASGFYTNASNYNTDDANSWYGKLISSCLAYADGGGDVAECPNQWWPRADAQSWLDARVHTPPSRMKHFVTDSSRNGQGPWTPPAGTYTDPQDWCNPPNRGLGARPTLRTGDPLQDARLWIKTPGESDGLCLRGTPGPEDPERGTVDPAAGDWFPEQALELVRLANPPILRGD
ncbi:MULTISPECIES: glycoside hydrolase family 6 protein [unclassified Streptomyces]|uniref:glycoside hydrolase family 6 protein n=1 Tax=unclassified Streptomyces TaxID=2593676 RepID=UPI00225A9290|nr:MULTISPECIES: glycoside hydrolase family 6 protein [unclassified Streptomyces]MCX4987687.1 glycoside hydrolase family 6 protein [Streptomyces sp. NBC_00568]MCX5007181.1 glycoside hydrolase family 6 protein [Streptomyces sp. NBC_00638]